MEKNKIRSLKATEQSLLLHFKNHNAKVYYSHLGYCNGRRVTYAWVIAKGACFHGHAQCSFNDMFCKQTGRTIALGRAFKNYTKEIKCSMPNFLKENKENDK